MPRTRVAIVQMILAVMTTLAPLLNSDDFAPKTVHDGDFVMCVDAIEQAGEAGAGGSESGMRQHHGHSCAGHVMALLETGVLMPFAENRDTNPGEPSSGVPRIFASRHDRPPLTPDLA